MSMEVLAYAKLNLTLDVLDRRPDGYHDMKMVMQSIGLTDRITMEPNEKGEVRSRSNLPYLPMGDKNLASAAVWTFYRSLKRPVSGWNITLDKSIPVCAGMAGGSSDAAAVLRALNRAEGEPYTAEELARVGEQIGSDVPYCVLGGTALAEGRGEVLTPLPALPRCWVVVCKPDFSVSTPELFRAIDSVRLRRRPDTAGVLQALDQGDLEGVARRMYNVFEDALPARLYSRVQDLKKLLIQQGALGANMSGTGSATFGLFREEQTAQQAAQILREQCADVYVCQTV